MKNLLIPFLFMAATAQAQDFDFKEVTYTPEATTFKLFAPDDAECYVKTGNQKIKMTKAGNCLWTATVKGNLKGQSYVFDAGHGETPGVFA